MLAAMPPGVLRVNQQVERIEQDDRAVTLHFADGTTDEVDVLVGADGIDSLVRRTLWGDTPKREHRLHIFGGFTFADDVATEPNTCVADAQPRPCRAAGPRSATRAATATSGGCSTATDPDAPAPADLMARATALAAEFAAPAARADRRAPSRRTSSAGCCATGGCLDAVVARAGPRSSATPRTRPPPTPPTAPAWPSRTATSSAAALRGVDLTDPAAVARALRRLRGPAQAAHRPRCGRPTCSARSSTTPRAPLQPLRDFVFDHTPFLQKVVGDTNPGEINKQLALITD